MKEQPLEFWRELIGRGAGGQCRRDAIRTLGIKTPLATQQVISCDLIDQGCDGGDTGTAYGYIKRSKGLVSGRQYPDTSHITGDTGSCRIFDLHDVLQDGPSLRGDGPVGDDLRDDMLDGRCKDLGVGVGS